MSSMTDHIRRTWTFDYDGQGNLVRINVPSTQFADIGPGEEITDTDLAGVTVTKPRRSLRDNNPLAKPKFPFFHPAFDLKRLEGLRTPRGARIDYEEIRLMRWEWEELLDLVRAQRAILGILEKRGCDPNSGARELLRMELESFERLLARLMRRSGNES